MSLQTRIGDLITAIGTDFKSLKTLITGTANGDLSGLTTTTKTSIVAAINEVKAGATGSPPSATATSSGIVELATTAEVLTGTDTTRAVTPAGVNAKIADLVNSAPGTLDTLGEISTALASDESLAAALTTSVAGKLAKASNLSDLADPAAARTNLSVYSKAELGNFDTDLAALYATAKT